MHVLSDVYAADYWWEPVAHLRRTALVLLDLLFFDNDRDKRQ